MVCRIFVKFRTHQIPGENVQTPLVVAKAVCLQLLNRDFDSRKDFLHCRGETRQDKARCYIVIDCDYPNIQPDVKSVDLHCYQVIQGENALSVHSPVNKDSKTFTNAQAVPSKVSMYIEVKSTTFLGEKIRLPQSSNPHCRRLLYPALNNIRDLHPLFEFDKQSTWRQTTTTPSISRVSITSSNY